MANIHQPGLVEAVFNDGLISRIDVIWSPTNYVKRWMSTSGRLLKSEELN